MLILGDDSERISEKKKKGKDYTMDNLTPILISIFCFCLAIFLIVVVSVWPVIHSSSWWCNNMDEYDRVRYFPSAALLLISVAISFLLYSTGCFNVKTGMIIAYVTLFCLTVSLLFGSGMIIRFDYDCADGPILFAIFFFIMGILIMLITFKVDENGYYLR